MIPVKKKNLADNKRKTSRDEKEISIIVLSNVTREGKDKILNEIESLIEEEETL